MAYRAYKCKKCGLISHAFEEEVDHLDWGFCFCFKGIEKLPPDPVIIHQTECFFSEPVLDSMNTAIELDRILTREARHLRQDKMVDVARKNA